jgi:hypothetical protein
VQERDEINGLIGMLRVDELRDSTRPSWDAAAVLSRNRGIELDVVTFTEPRYAAILSGGRNSINASPRAFSSSRAPGA